MKNVLGAEFFDRRTLTVARELLGKFLVRKVGNREVALMITETEAYFGFKDQASKARRGKTPGNLPMYAGPGTIYVYFTYGMHWMLNIVTEREEYPAAVLIRGLEVSEEPKKRSAKTPRSGEIYRTPAQGVFAPLNGPGKLTKFLKIDKKLNTKKLGKAAGLWVEDRGVKINPRHIKKTPRVGIDYAGEYVHKPWRFVLRPNEKAGTQY